MNLVYVTDKVTGVLTVFVIHEKEIDMYRYGKLIHTFGYSKKKPLARCIKDMMES